MSAKVITVILQKGGSGKSSTSQAISAIYGSQGKRVLLIDLDPQRNTSYASGITNPDKTITDVLYGECTAQDAIVSCTYYDLIPSDRYLSNIQSALVDTSVPDSVRNSISAAEFEIVSMTLLKKSLKSILDSYDLIVIDSAPSLGNLAFMALVASDYALVTAEAAVYSLVGLHDLAKTVQAVKASYNPSLEVAGVLLCRVNARTTLSKDIKEIILSHKEDMGLHLFETQIRNSVEISKAQMAMMSLIEFAPKAKVTQDYMDFCAELAERIKL